MTSEAESTDKYNNDSEEVCFAQYSTDFVGEWPQPRVVFCERSFIVLKGDWVVSACICARATQRQQHADPFDWGEETAADGGLPLCLCFVSAPAG